MKYVITSDLDGTLLNNEGELSDETLQLIEKLLNDDILFVPCTSRAVKDLPQCFDKTTLRYFVCSNGAAIYDRVDDVIIKSFTMDSRLALSILDCIDLEKTFVSVVNEGTVYSEKRFFDVFLNEDLHDRNAILSMQKTRISIDSVYERLKSFPEIEKLHLNYRDSETRDDMLRLIPTNENYVIASSSARNIEITSHLADKGKAAVALCEHLQLYDYKMIAFGDNLNDIPLFNVAHTKVKMLNGLDELYAHTNAETDYTNDKSGVARFLTKTLY